MQVFFRLKKLFAVLGFLALITAGYFAVSLSTSCPAEAASCHCSICVYGNGMPDALQTIYNSTIVAGVDFATDAIKVYFNLALDKFKDAGQAEIELAEANLIRWIDTFWYYNLLPAKQASTDQLNVRDVDQSRMVGSFSDAMEANRTARAIALEEVKRHREQRPSENACVGATVVGGMTRAQVLRTSYNTAAPLEMLPRTANAVGTPAARGSAADQKSRWDNYSANYCDPNANAGTAGCTTAGPMAGRDVDVTGEIFRKDTIDVRDPANQKLVNDIATNMIEPMALDPIPPSALSSPQGQEQMLKTLSYQARRQAAYDAYYHVIARRLPGTNTGTFIREIRQAAGLPPSAMAPAAGQSYNPSHNEVMQTMLSDRFRSGRYATDQIDEPESNQAELVMQQAFQAMQMNDVLDLMDRYSVMLAAQVGPEVVSSHNRSDRAQDRRTR